MSDLKGKVAIVTGGSKGIGAGIVSEFIGSGASVIIADLDEETGKATASKYDNALFFKMNIANEDNWKELFKFVIEKCGHVDILVNNAGIAPNPGIENIEHMTLDEWNKVINIDLTAVMLGTHYAVLNMKKNGGSIINISSVGPDLGDTTTIGYNVAKNGVRVLSQESAGYCREQGYQIRINTISPGNIDSPMLKEVYTPESLESLKKQHVVGLPTDIGKLAAFLASDDAVYVNGSNYNMDGGLLVGKMPEYTQIK